MLNLLHVIRAIVNILDGLRQKYRETDEPMPPLQVDEPMPTPLTDDQLPELTDDQIERALDYAASQRSSENLDWRLSIVDRLKLLNLNSHLDARRALAANIGFTGPVDGSSTSNQALNDAVGEALKQHKITLPLD